MRARLLYVAALLSVERAVELCRDCVCEVWWE